MPLIYNGGKSRDLHKWVKDRNLEHQYFLLETMVGMILRQRNARFVPAHVYALHAAAGNFVVELPGKIRFDPVHIRGSAHIPEPDPRKVEDQLTEFLRELNSSIPENSDAWLAAFSYWKLNWIHPFSDGNGRTARAFACLVLCVKKGFWLPGSRSLLEQLRKQNELSHQLLNEAHAEYSETENVDLTDLENLWFNLSYEQMVSLPDSN